MPGEGPAAIAKPPAGTYPAWSVSTQYRSWNKVLYQGLPYQAKWSNQGVSPATAAALRLRLHRRRPGVDSKDL